MSMFSSIMNKIFRPATAAEPGPSPAATPSASPTAVPTAAPTSTPTAQPPSPTVDVVAVLTDLAAHKGGGGNWKTSIVDLLKLLDLDSSLTARQELSKELNCPADKLGDSAQMNMWLHKAVLQKLADNGGNVPADLL